MAKIIERAEDLAGILRGLQSQGKIIVFTNGAFDLLHVGHIRSLKDAKLRGDFLIVGVNTDESVKRYKDPSLPVHPLAERIEVLEALTMIDYITTIPEPTADAVLRTLRPDLLAKGTDYTEESVPERATVLGYGGRIIIVGDPKTHSTRDLIKKIQGMTTRTAAAKALPSPPVARATKPSRTTTSGGKEIYVGKTRVRVKVRPVKRPHAAAARKPARRRVAARKR